MTIKPTGDFRLTLNGVPQESQFEREARQETQPRSRAMTTRTFTGLPSPFNNPTMEGYEVLATSPEVDGAFRDTKARALVVRYADGLKDNITHIVWQEKSKASDEWRYRPGSNASNCESVIMALMGIN